MAAPALNILETIAAKRRIYIEEKKKQVPLKNLISQAEALLQKEAAGEVSAKPSFYDSLPCCFHLTAMFCFLFTISYCYDSYFPIYYCLAIYCFDAFAKSSNCFAARPLSSASLAILMPSSRVM